jgi:hypothetical protein
VLCLLAQRLSFSSSRQTHAKSASIMHIHWHSCHFVTCVYTSIQAGQYYSSTTSAADTTACSTVPLLCKTCDSCILALIVSIVVTSSITPRQQLAQQRVYSRCTLFEFVRSRADNVIHAALASDWSCQHCVYRNRSCRLVLCVVCWLLDNAKAWKHSSIWCWVLAVSLLL